ncbi:MAG: hypothetical protein V3U26_00385 [Dehalococcoidia bacterium]
MRTTGSGPGYRFMARPVILAVVVLLLAVGCASSSDETPTPPSPTVAPTPTTAAPTPTVAAPEPQEEEGDVVDLIAYVGLDSNIFTIRPDGTDQRQLTFPISRETVSLLFTGQEESVFNWPTWSPDATRIAYTGFSEQGAFPGSLYVVNARGGPSRELYQNPPDTVGRFVATRSPHYIYWAPDSQRIAFLAPSSFNLTLFVIKADGSEQARPLANGAPSYLSWSPNGRYLLLHLLEDLLLVDTSRDLVPSPLAPDSSAFRAPSWAPDSQSIAYIDRLNGTDGLVVGDLTGADGEVVTTIDQLGVFLWSPSANHLAFTTLIPRPDLPVPTYTGLNVIDTDTSERYRITEDEVVAFFWSPDGGKLAYVTVDRVNGLFSWNVTDSRGNDRQKLADFTPSSETLFTLFQFFDQYAYSNSLWSPDSDSLVYAGREPGTDGTGTDRVFVLPVDGITPPRAIAQGTLAFWSPR